MRTAMRALCMGLSYWFRCDRMHGTLKTCTLIKSPPMSKTIFILTIGLLAVLPTFATDEKDVAFADRAGKPLLLDRHVPDGQGPFPAAILIHGGGFDQGSKSTNVKPLFDVLTDAGIAWFSIDYRMAPEFHLTEASEDVDSAIKWLKANTEKYRVDASRIALIG